MQPTTDILRHLGPTFLGSRLKRLGERMQASAARVIADAGLPVQPAHMPILAALDQGSLTIGELAETIGVSQPGVTRGVSQLVEMGLVDTQHGADRRQRTISLTDAGNAALTRAKLLVWPRVEEAVGVLLGNEAERFMTQIADVEDALEAMPLDLLAARADPKVMTIHEYRDELAPHFRDINAEWISAMFHLEPTDQEVLDNPRAKVIEPGGTILFVEAKGLGIVGTCALQRAEGQAFELTKMGVRETARGAKAGEFLLSAIIERAMSLKADPLYLLTNSRCAPAIHLYEKLGFQHDAEIMERYGARYERCDVAMRYRPSDAS